MRFGYHEKVQIRHNNMFVKYFITVQDNIDLGD